MAKEDEAPRTNPAEIENLIEQIRAKRWPQLPQACEHLAGA
jgi:hypothetical protein